MILTSNLMIFSLKFSKFMFYQFIVFLQLWFWSSFHVNFFYQFKIWFSKNGNFKQYFVEVNEFIWKIHKHKSGSVYYSQIYVNLWTMYTTTLPSEEMTKIKVVDLKKLHNFVVDNFLIWNHFVKENYIWISKFWNFNFQNVLK